MKIGNVEENVLKLSVTEVPPLNGKASAFGLKASPQGDHFEG